MQPDNSTADVRRRGPRRGRACLQARAIEIAEEAGHARRRDELVRRTASATALPVELVDRAYDVAREEHVDPPLALALLECGVGVVELGDEPDAPTASEREPDWIAPVEPETAQRERRLRTSFRRLRAQLERSDSAADALLAFADEPDVRATDWREQTG